MITNADIPTFIPDKNKAMYNPKSWSDNAFIL